MANIPLKVKVTLINNYIQTNYLKSRGKSEHEEYLINDILTDIKEDLSTLEKERTTEHVPLGLITRDLKNIQEKQKSLGSGLESVVEELKSVIESMKSLQETQSDPDLNLDKVIKDLEDLGAE
jgi:chromosome segregation ATPase